MRFVNVRSGKVGCRNGSVEMYGFGAVLSCEGNGKVKRRNVKLLYQNAGKGIIAFIRQGYHLASLCDVTAR